MIIIAKTYTIVAECDDCGWLVDAVAGDGLSDDKINTIAAAAKNHAAVKKHNVTIFRDLRTMEPLVWATDSSEIFGESE